MSVMVGRSSAQHSLSESQAHGAAASSNVAGHHVTGKTALGGVLFWQLYDLVHSDTHSTSGDNSFDRTSHTAPHVPRVRGPEILELGTMTVTVTVKAEQKFQQLQ